MPGLDGTPGRGDPASSLALTAGSLTGRPLLRSSTVERLTDGGYLGVDIFFVLSGFLITALLLNEEDRHGSVHFWIVLRGGAPVQALPALVLLLAVYLLYTLATHRPLDAVFDETVGHAGLLHNWRMIYRLRRPAERRHGAPLVPGIEEQFYLVWPAFLLLFLSLRRTATLAISLLVTLIVVVIAWRAWIWHETLALAPSARGEVSST